MATPYATPKYPRVPHTTPTSHSLARNVPRAPIYNPYDKFSQPEFDAWIGGLTGALKRALGREDYHEEPIQDEEQVERDDEVMDDSFAEVLARRAAKGKERAIDIGGEDDPIVIMSDSEEERELSEGDEDAENWEEQDRSDDLYEDDEDGEAEQEDLQPSPIEVVNLLSDEDSEGEDIDGLATAEQTSQHGEDDEYGEGSSDDPEADSDDEDGDMDADGVLEHETHYNGEDDGEDNVIPQAEDTIWTVELPDPWEGPSTYAEDFYSAGDILPDTRSGANPHLLPNEQTENVTSPEATRSDETERSKAVSGMPVPLERTLVEEVLDGVEVVDPWSGLHTYADDFYGGAEVQESNLRTPLPSMSDATIKDDETGMFLIPEWSTTETSRTPPVSHRPLFDPTHTEKEENVALLVSDAKSKVADDVVKSDMIASISNDGENSQLAEEQDQKSCDLEDSHQLGRQALSHERTFKSPRQWRQSSKSPPPPTFNAHVDWNWPPAFAVGRVASRAGHLHNDSGNGDDDEIVELSDDEEDYQQDEDFLQEVEAGVSVLDSRHASAGVTFIQSSALGDSRDDENLPRQENIRERNEPLHIHTEAVAVESAFIVSEGVESHDVLIDDIYGDLDMTMATGEAFLADPHDAPDFTTEPFASTGGFIDGLFASRAESLERAFSNEGSVNVANVTSDVHEETAEEVHVLFDEPALSTEATARAWLPEDHHLQQGTQVREASTDASPTPTKVQITGPSVASIDDKDDRISSINVADGTVSIPTQIHSEAGDYFVEDLQTAGINIEDSVYSQSSSGAVTEDVVIDEVSSISSSIKLRAQDYVIIDDDGKVAENGQQANSTVGNTVETTHDTDFMDIPPDVRLEQSPRSPYEPSQRNELSVSYPSPISITVPDASIIDISMIVSNSGQLATLSETDQVSGEASSVNDGLGGPQSLIEGVSSIEGVDQSMRMLEDGIPMPVSADPAVRDPTSVSHTPVPSSTPTRGQSELAREQYARVLSKEPDSPLEDAASRSTSRAPSRGKSVSSLFTSVTTDNSLPVTPRVGSAGLGSESAADSPLKQVVTADIPVGTTHVNNSEELSSYKNEHNLTDSPRLPRASDQNSQQAIFAPVPHASHRAASDARGVPEFERPSLDHETGVDQLELAYPSDSESAGEDLSAQTRRAGDRILVAHGVGDIDARDDVDPDYASNDKAATTQQRSLSVRPHPRTSPDDPFDSIGNESDAANGGNANIDAARQEYKQNEIEEAVTDHVTYKRTDSAESGGVGHGDTAGAERSLKRKRNAPVLPPRLTRAMSAKEAERSKPRLTLKLRPLRLVRNKETQPSDHDAQGEHNTSVAPRPRSESISANSSASDASRLLISQSQSSSRASSVVSLAPSNGSMVAPASPTVFQASHQTSLPAPFIHAHEALRHHHGRPVPLQKPSAPHIREYSPSLPSSTPQGPSEAGPSQPLLPVVSQKPLPSSPVTRSHCRFHKVSLPRDEDEEDGLRVHFVVPGCSLGNRELMEEEHIEDLGLAILDANTRLVADIESVDFSPYLLGVLRQLVGVDLLREQDIFYLPQPGEQYRWKSKRRSRVSHATIPGRPRKSLGTRNFDVGSASPRQERNAIGETSSRAGSMSTQASPRGARLNKRGSLTTTASISDSELSDLSEDNGGDAESTPSLVTGEDELNQIIEVETLKSESASKASSVATHRLQTRRSKRLGIDAAAYQPGETASGSTDEESQLQKQTKSGKRSLKRGRTDEPQDASAGTTHKKRRVRRKPTVDQAPTEDRV